VEHLELEREPRLRLCILRGLGRPRLAESLLLALRDGFLAEDVPFDTALVSLEMAALYAEQGRTGKLKRLASEMIAIFSCLHVPRDVMETLPWHECHPGQAWRRARPGPLSRW
jgi:hypothetical protein